MSGRAMSMKVRTLDAECPEGRVGTIFFQQESRVGCCWWCGCCSQAIAQGRLHSGSLKLSSAVCWSSGPEHEHSAEPVEANGSAIGWQANAGRYASRLPVAWWQASAAAMPADCPSHGGKRVLPLCQQIAHRTG
eukprot:Skav213777  [mRNA]  locus=scaffold3228:129690:131518:+ [translate_table: standard]